MVYHKAADEPIDTQAMTNQPIDALDLSGPTFHHIGVACPAIDPSIALWERRGYQVEGGQFEDREQGIRGQFMTGCGPRVELVAPLPDSRILDPWLSSGSPIYHFAYLVGDLSQAIDTWRYSGAVTVRRPMPAVAFDGRDVTFLLVKDGWLIELIDRGIDS